MTWLEEKLRNSDYPKFIKLFNSEDPKYCFVCISACRGLNDDAIASKKTIDDLNHRNNVLSNDLKHQLIANNIKFMQVVGHYDEKDALGHVYEVEETSFLAYSYAKEKLLEVTRCLGKLYEQNSILFIDTNHIAQIVWLDDDMEPPEWTNKKSKVNFDQNSIANNFTSLGRLLHQRRFQLEDLKEVFYNKNYITTVGYRLDEHYLDCTRMEEKDYLEHFEKKFEEWRDHAI